MIIGHTCKNPNKQEDVDDPRFECAGRVHDWRNHIGEEVQKIWHTFTPEQRMILATDADSRASREQWD